MPRLLMMMSDEYARDAFVQGATGLSGWLVDYAEDLQELQMALSMHHWDILALDTASFERVESLKPAYLQSLGKQLSVIVLIEPEQLGQEESLLGFEVAGVVPCDKKWLTEPRRVYGRLRLMVWLWRKHNELRISQIKKARRDAELAVLSELSRELFGVMDEKTLIMHIVHGLGVRCQNAAVAYLSTEPVEDEYMPGLFSDSEVEDLDRELTFNDHTTEPALNIIHQYAQDDELLAFLQPKQHDSWVGALNQQSPVVFRRKPSLGAFPGMEPVWHRLKHGCVFIVPVWGRVEPLGLLIVAELELQHGEPLWSSHGLQTLAHQLPAPSN